MPARAFTAIVNPISGGGAAAQRWELVGEALRRRGHDVAAIVTEGREHAIAAATAAAGQERVVVAVGGDGTVRDVVQGIVAAQLASPDAPRTPLAIVPAGRGNDLVRALSIPHDVDPLVELLATGEHRAIDLLRVGDVVVPGNVYFGLDGRSTRIINRCRWVPPTLLYRLAPFVATIGWRRFTATIAPGADPDPTVSGAPTRIAAHMVVIANSGRYGHGINIVPTAVLDDGLLDVLVIEGVFVAKLSTLMSQAVNGEHLSRPDVTTWRASSASVEVDRPLPLYADGEEIGTLPCHVSVMSRALDVIAPAPA